VGCPSAIVITRARPGTKSAAATYEGLDAAELPVLTAAIPLREAITASFGTRPPAMVLVPYAAVLDELEAALNPKEKPRGRRHR
jgi:hypothetical protein